MYPSIATYSTDSSGNVTGLVGPGGVNLLGFTSNPTIARGVLANYKAAIVAASDTVTNYELDALYGPLSTLVRSSVWPKLKELWIPLGTDATKGALVKLKGAAMSHVGMVTGDYNSATGITGDGIGKALNTNFNPTTAAVTAGEWGFGVFALKTTGGGILGGTLSGTTTYLSYNTSSDGKINNVGTGANNGPQTARWNAIQVGGGNITAWLDGYTHSTTAYSSGTLPNTALTLLAANSSFWSTQSISGYAAWTPSLTATEMRILAQFFEDANVALWRTAYQPTLVASGDSNTAGFGLGSPTTERWPVLACAALGLTEDNQGVSSSTMSDNDDGGSSSRWVTARKILNSSGRAPTLMTVALGTNDDRYKVSAANFLADYETWLTYQLSAGIDPRQICLFSPILATDVLSSASRQKQFGDIIYGLAVKYGTDFFDARAVSVTFQADNLHMNSAGHTALATAFVNYISSKSRTLIRAAKL